MSAPEDDETIIVECRAKEPTLAEVRCPNLTGCDPASIHFWGCERCRAHCDCYDKALLAGAAHEAREVVAYYCPECRWRGPILFHLSREVSQEQHDDKHKTCRARVRALVEG